MKRLLWFFLCLFGRHVRDAHSPPVDRWSGLAVWYSVGPCYRCRRELPPRFLGFASIPFERDEVRVEGGDP